MKNQEGLSKLAQKLYRRAVNDHLIATTIGDSCCSFEFFQYVSCHFSDLSLEFRDNGYESDLLFICGPISLNYWPVVEEVYAQLPGHSLIVAVGTCSISGGVYREGLVINNLEERIPVDLYVPGCPITPEGVKELFERIPEALILKSGQSEPSL